MTLSRIDLLRVKAADGLLSDVEQAELQAAGHDPFAWRPLRSLLREGLAAPDSPDLAFAVLAAAGLVEDGHVDWSAVRPDITPDLADGILDALALDSFDAAPLRAALSPSQTPDLVGAVMGALELEEDAVDVSVMAPDTMPELADAVLAELGLEEDGTPSLREALFDAPPDFADDVMDRLGLEQGRGPVIGDLVRDALATSDDAPDLTGDIFSALDLEEDTHPPLRELLEMDGPVDLWPGVSEAIGAGDDAGGLMREAIAAAGSVDLADAIMAEIGAEGSAAASDNAASDNAASDNVVPLRRNFRRNTVAALVFAAAAALLMVMLPGLLPGGSGGQDPVPGFEVAEVDNAVDILELDAPDSMVQFFQAEEGAPTIIFISELDDAVIDEDASGDLPR